MFCYHKLSWLFSYGAYKCIKMKSLPPWVWHLQFNISGKHQRKSDLQDPSWCIMMVHHWTVLMIYKDSSTTLLFKEKLVTKMCFVKWTCTHCLGGSVGYSGSDIAQQNWNSTLFWVSAKIKSEPNFFFVLMGCALAHLLIFTMSSLITRFEVKDIDRN